MKKVFFLFVLLSSCSQKQGGEAFSSLSAAEFNAARSDDAIVLDVRTPGEFAGGFIEGAVNLDIKAADFERKLDSLDKSKDYLVYCAVGGRSSRASDLMRQKGFTSVRSLDGGIEAWEADGLPVIKK
jgi:rhodanese-related sulfurtransferase